MATLHVLRVFCAPGGAHGNPLGVFLDGADVPVARRQAVAHELGFSETVFVDDAAAGVARIYTPALELPFAGHPMVGTAWLLRHVRQPVGELRPPAGEVTVRYVSETTWVAARPEWSPPFGYIALDSVIEVDRLREAPGGADAYCWAWEDEPTGVIRARSFAPGAGIAEDEATGSAALALCARLERPILVRQGKGSLISAQPLADGRVEIGGLVTHDETRQTPI